VISVLFWWHAGEFLDGPGKCCLRLATCLAIASS